MRVETRQVNYFDQFQGYFAKPKSPPAGGLYSGIVMVHDRFGVNTHIKDMTRELAGQGYVVLAVDLLADKSVEELVQERALENMRAAVTYLTYQHNTSKIGVLGLGFGGGQALALSEVEGLSAIVIYYGTPLAIEKLSHKIPLLGIFGGEDPVVPISQVEQFKTKIKETGIPHEIYIYSGVGHAFMDPAGPEYAPQEAKDAWDKTLAFLAKHLR